VGRPACFYPFLHGFWTFLRRRNPKKFRRKGEKAAEITKNATGSEKSPQGAIKVLQGNKKACRRTKKCSRDCPYIFLIPFL
jgi:hypothetical protein